MRRPTRHVSVKDVAARSGVSFQTTSKVLNGGGSVSEATRARIIRAASDPAMLPLRNQCMASIDGSSQFTAYVD